MGEVFLRRMAARDVKRVAELEKICFPMPWSEKSLAGELGNRHAYYIVLEEDKTVIAYGGMWLIIDEAHVTNVAVAPEHRGRSLGRTLMRELIRAACRANINQMTLEVRVSNAVAQKLYYSMGFKPVGLRKGYYSNNNEDALILLNPDIIRNL